MKSETIDITGKKFGYLLCIGRAEGSRGANTLWDFLCLAPGCRTFVQYRKSDVTRMAQKGRQHCGCLSGFTHSDNARKRIGDAKRNPDKPQSNNKTGFNGVSSDCGKNGKLGLLRVRGEFNGNRQEIRGFSDVRSAVLVRQSMELEYFETGKFEETNRLADFLKGKREEE